MIPHMSTELTLIFYGNKLWLVNNAKAMTS